MRENVDHSYRWTSRNIRNTVLFGLVAPFCVYKVTSINKQSHDRRRGMKSGCSTDSNTAALPMHVES